LSGLGKAAADKKKAAGAIAPAASPVSKKSD
jgi:hypothetical protein